MQVTKEQGLSNSNMNETLGYIDVNVQGTGRNNNKNAFIQISGQSTRVVNQRGLTVVLYNENFSFHSSNRFNTYNSVSEQNRMAEFLRDLPSNKYMFIVSYDGHNTNSNLTNAMLDIGALRYSEIPFIEEYDTYNGYVYNRRTPYCGVGTTDIGIVYESLGSAKQNALYADAKLSIILPEIGYVGVQGYGDNLLSRSSIQASDYHKPYVEVIRGQPSLSYHCYRFSFESCIENQIRNNDRGAWIRVDIIDNDTGFIFDTVYNKFERSHHFRKNWGILNPLSEGRAYRLTIVCDEGLEVKIKNMKLVKCSRDNPFNTYHIGRIKDDYPSSLTLRNSFFGMEPYYADELEYTFNDSNKLFNSTRNIMVYDYDTVYGTQVTGTSTTDMVDIDDSQIGIFLNAIVISDEDFSPTIECDFYDVSGTLISSSTVVNFNLRMQANTPYMIEHLAYKVGTVDTINYSFFQNYRFGYDAQPNINITSTIPANAVKIQYKFSKNGGGNYELVFPCTNSIIPKISKKGYMSPAFLGDIIPIICDPPIVEVVQGDVDNGRVQSDFSWVVDESDGYHEIRIYKNSDLQVILEPTETEWNDNPLEADKENYQIYFIKNGRYCLSEIIYDDQPDPVIPYGLIAATVS